jgi:hypothetical protein
MRRLCCKILARGNGRVSWSRLLGACATDEQGGEWFRLSAVQTRAQSFISICLCLPMTTQESHAMWHANEKLALSLALPLLKFAESADMSTGFSGYLKDTAN